VTDPEQVVSAAREALGSVSSDDDTCLVALQVTPPVSAPVPWRQGDAARADSARPSEDPRSQR
jgi:hypothetical protein